MKLYRPHRGSCWSNLIAIAVMGIAVLATLQTSFAANVTVNNKCSYTVYPGIAPATFDNGGWEMAPGSSVSFTLPNGWNGRIWGRKGCNTASPAVCATGSCGGTGLQCAGTTGAAGTSLAEFNLDASGTDFYDVSYVDGFDNPIGIEVSNPSCVSPNTCTAEPLTSCLASDVAAGGQECKSPCTATGNPQFCCAGAFNTPSTCITSNWPAQDQAYITTIHSSCPSEYAYAYDDPVGLHTCATGANYTITFCPNGSSSGGGTGAPAAPTNLTATAASSSQVNLSWTASTTSGVTYTVLRNGSVDKTGVTGTTLSDTGLQASTTYSYTVEAVDSGGTSGPSNQVSATTQAGSGGGGTTALQINAGGPAVGSFVADTGFTGGSTINHANTIDLSGVTNPAPAAVYQSARVGNFTYTLTGFGAGSSNTLRLHFAETFWTAAGSRIFNVSINGTQVLANFDVFAAAGGQNRAVVREFTSSANSSGQYVITFTSVKDNSLVSAIEVVSGSSGGGGGSCTASPSTPTGLAASGTTSSGTTLSWSAVTPPAGCSITGYTVFQNGSAIATTNSTSFTVSGLNASTTYTFGVAASDSFGMSAQSSGVSVTTASGGGGGGTGACAGVANLTLSDGSVHTPMFCQEFNGAAGPPDTSVWAFDLGGGGFGNGEAETYCGPPGFPGNPSICPTTFSTATSPNYIDGNGHLVIWPRLVNGTWISGRMKTQGKENFQYGIIEASIELPNTTTQGLWPAFWSLGSNITTVPWPTCGEADIMENWSPQVLGGAGTAGDNATIHTQKTGGSGVGRRFTFPSGQATNTGFHTYGVIWTPNSMAFFVDNPNAPFFTATPANLPSGDLWPFNAPIFLLTNVAVGGTLGGSISGLTVPAPMQIDFIRVYSVPGSTITP